MKNNQNIDKTRDRSSNKCELSHQEFKKKINSHELWKIDKDKMIVIFYKIVVLRKLCHRIKSMRLAEFQVNEKILNIQEFNKHINKKIKMKSNLTLMYK